MRLENERLCVEIAELGAEVLRIYDKKNGREVLWEADPAYWKRHSPVLFPNVGKTYRNTVLINGTQYPTSQHGFARDSIFKCTNSTKDSASFLLVSSDETKEVYPFDFELSSLIHYRKAACVWSGKSAMRVMRICILRSADIRLSALQNRRKRRQIIF